MDYYILQCILQNFFVLRLMRMNKKLKMNGLFHSTNAGEQPIQVRL